MRGAVEAVEASYGAVGAGRVEEWLQQTVRALAPVMGLGAGIIGYRFDARGSPRDWSVTTPFVHEGSPVYATTTTALFELAPSSLRVPLYRPTHRAHLFSELNGYRLDELPLGDAAAAARELGIVDLVGLHAGNPDGLGAMFGAGVLTFE
jgi:hypothetical protein